MRPRQFSDDDLVRVARECFLEHGAGVSTAVIAERLGVSHAALFKRVGSKEALLRKVLIQPFSPPWFELLEQEPDSRPVREQLLEIAERLDEYLRHRMPEFSVIIGRGQEAARRMLAGSETVPVGAHRAIASWFHALLRQGRIEVADPEALALMLLGALEARLIVRAGLGLDYPDGGPGYVAFVVDQLCAGIVPVKTANERSNT